MRLCPGRAPALPLPLEDTHCAGMVVDSTVVFGDAVIAQCVGLRVGVPAGSR